MEYTEIQEIIEKAKSEYKIIGKVFCPYFDNYAHLTLKGFNHLIGNRFGKRDDKVIFERLNSIKYIHQIISKSGTLQEYENSGTQYFGFIAIVRRKKYKVVVLKDNDLYKFISIIPQYRTGTKGR